MAHKKQALLQKQTLLHLLASRLLACVALLAVALLPMAAMAQDFDDFDDFDGGEDLLLTDGVTSGGASFTDYIIGEVGLIASTNSAVERSSTLYNLGMNVPFAFGRFYATYGGQESKISTTQTLRDNVANFDGLAATQVTTTRTSDTDLRDAFVQLNLGSYVTLSAGRQRNAWGQFEFFSPAASMQPLNTNTTSLLPNKLDLLQSQDQLQINIFPTSRIELSLYAMTSFRRDKTAEENAKNLISPYSTNYLNQNVRIGLNFEEVANPQQSATRLAFYPNWGTVAFTQHKGYNVSSPLLRTALEFNTLFDDDDELGDGDIFGYVDTPSFVESVYINDAESYLYYPEGTLNAFEISVPTGKWTWRYEMAVIESVSGLGRATGNISIYAFDTLTVDSVNEFLDASYASTRDPKIRGTALFESTTTTTAAGFQYQGAEWNIDLTVLIFSEAEPLNADGERLVAAFNALEAQQTTEAEGNFGNFPLVNGFRKGGDEDQHTYGFSFGALEAGVGGAGIYSYNVTEDFSLGFSAGYIRLSAESNSNNDTYVTNVEGINLQISVARRF